MFKKIFPDIVLLVRQCGKYGTARQATDDNVIWCRKVAVFMRDK
jgi:hypothetical protein